MKEKSKVQVVIGGKVLTMGGYEDPAHIQNIATCVNQTLQELEQTDEFRCLPTELKPVFIYINLADELLKARESAKQLESDLDLREKELADLRQELSDLELKLELLEGNAEDEA